MSNILGIGVDILEISRISSLVKKNEKRIFEKILSNDEIKYLVNLYGEKFYEHQKSISFLAKRFSCKEAILKAFGVGIGENMLNHISILNNTDGSPFVYLDKEMPIKKIYQDNIDIKISISDTDSNVIAFVVINLIKHEEKT